MTSPILLAVILMVPILLGVLLFLALADRYWGTSALGGLIRKKEKLIYEERSWWWEHVMLYFAAAITLTVLSLWPYTLPSAPPPPSLFYYNLIVIWGLMILASLIVGWHDRRKQTAQRDIAVDCSSQMT